MTSTNLSVRECDGHTVLTLRGELDLEEAVYVAAVLIAVASRDPRIVVDLKDLEFIDSSGVAALARGREQARQAGGDLILAAPQRQVLRILGVTRQIHDFSVYASAEQASSIIGSSPGAAAPAQPATSAPAPAAPASPPS